MSDHPGEDFIPFLQVVEAALELGIISGDSGECDVAPIIGAMTGLDMAQYDLVPCAEVEDQCGWHLVRKPAGRRTEAAEEDLNT